MSARMQVIIQDSELDPAGVPKAGDLPMSPKALRPPTPPKQQQANSKFRAPAVLPDQQLGLEDMPDQKL